MEQATGTAAATAVPTDIPAKVENVGTENSKEVTPQSIKKMLKAKVDGQEIDVEEAEAIAAWQKKEASNRRFEEASKMKKQSEQLIKLLQSSKDDPRVLEQILAHPSIGASFKDIAEKYLYDIIQKEQMSPEQRELMELREEKEKARLEKEEREEEERQQAFSKLEQEYTQSYQTDIIDTLEKSGLPKTEQTIGRMARYMLMGLQRGVTLKAADIVELVREDYIKDIKGLFGNLNPEKVFEFLGDDVAKKLRKADLAKLKAGYGDKSSTNDPQPKRIRKDEKREQLSKEDWRKRIYEKL